VTTDFGGVEYATGMGIQPDGAIVVAGQGGPTYEFVLARYRGDPTATHVSIDVKPGSDTNPITLGSNGVVPVAVLSSDTFDASKVDPSSVCFGDAEVPAERDCSEAHGTGHSADVNTDGKLDLLLHFETQQTGIDAGDTSACLTGRTVDGSSIEGCDSIVTQ
jgi:hypothetical protein